MDERSYRTKYLVTRKEALRYEGSRRIMRGSEYWPIVVEVDMRDMPESEQGAHEFIVRKALDLISETYHPINHEYVVVAFDNARVVSFKPRREYDVSIRRF